ncbi:MAG TPA: cysteine desulfurase [bacterium]|nr:cysteine desulfurase [bacterium]
MAPNPSALSPVFETARYRKDFPILGQLVHGHPLVYLDNAATTQKPLSVIEATDRYYRETNSNIHRGVHLLSQKATEAYEAARERTRAFLNAESANEIIFTRGATEGINLVAQTWGRKNIGFGDEIVLSCLEHHSNIVPWQMLAEEKGARIRVAPIDDDGEFLLDEYKKLLSDKTKLVAVTQVSNALGTVTPIAEIIRLAHDKGAAVLVDGAQAVAHLRVDVRALDCDFYVFSAHKLYGPTGVGALYGKLKTLNAMPPYQGGGDMIATVTFEKTTYKKSPYKFEAGTPNIAGGVALTAALDYVAAVGLPAIAAHERDLLVYGTEKLSGIPGLTIIGRAKEKAGVISFTLGDIHPHDIGTILDRQGVAIRAGHHCAQPVMDRFGVPATARASFALYNTREEVDALEAAVRKVLEVFN